jgi:hypothetical protein
VGLRKRNKIDIYFKTCILMENPFLSMEKSTSDIIFHNPDNLTDQQVDILRRGWRLLLVQELNTVPSLPKNDESLEIWDSTHGEWDTLADLHHHTNRTYRTKRPL